MPSHSKRRSETHEPSCATHVTVRRFSWRIAALLASVAALWIALTLPGELRFVEESQRVESLIANVVVVPKRAILTVSVPNGVHPNTYDISVSTFRQWKVGDRVEVLMHPHGPRIDDFFGRHSLSLSGVGGIGLLAVVLVFAERTMARRRKTAAQTPP